MSSSRCRQTHLLLTCHFPRPASVLAGTSEHPFPFPPLCWPPKACCTFSAQSSVKAPAWQRDRGGSGSVSYRSPFLPPQPLSFPSLASSFPHPDLRLGPGLELLFHFSEIFPPLPKPWLSVGTECRLLAQAPSRAGGCRGGDRAGAGDGRLLSPLQWWHPLSLPPVLALLALDQKPLHTTSFLFSPRASDVVRQSKQGRKAGGRSTSPYL